MTKYTWFWYNLQCYYSIWYKPYPKQRLRSSIISSYIHPLKGWMYLPWSPGDDGVKDWWSVLFFLLFICISNYHKQTVYCIGLPLKTLNLILQWRLDGIIFKPGHILHRVVGLALQCNQFTYTANFCTNLIASCDWISNRILASFYINFFGWPHGPKKRGKKYFDWL